MSCVVAYDINLDLKQRNKGGSLVAMERKFLSWVGVITEMEGFGMILWLKLIGSKYDGEEGGQ